MKHCNKLIALSLAILMLFTAALPAAAADATVADGVATATAIEVGTVTAMPGETVDVPVTISGNTGIASALMTLDFDPSLLTLTNVTAGEAFSELDFTCGNLENPCILLWDSEMQQSTRDGVIVTLTFAVSELATGEDEPEIRLSYRNGEIFDVNLDSVNAAVTNGAITVIDYIPGDLNGDRLVNNKDIVLLRRYVVGIRATAIHEAAADVNADGLINNKDIVTIRRFVVGIPGIELKPSTHTHTYDSAWSQNATHHWHAATCAHTDRVSNMGEHVFGTDAACTVCGYIGAAYDENGFLKDSLPESLDFGGDAVSILHWNAEHIEFTTDEKVGMLVYDEIFLRNVNIEERLGVQLEFTELAGENSNIDNFVNHVQNCHNAGDTTYDIIPTYSRTAAALSTRGLYCDLNSIEQNYIDLTKPWWPDAITNNLTVGDSLYFLTGDCSTNAMYLMYGIWFNKQLAEQHKLGNLYELVRTKKWTIDKLIELTANIYDNPNGSTPHYGFIGVDYGLDAFYTGSDLQLVEATRDASLLKLSDDYFSDKTSALVAKLGAACTGADWKIDSNYGLMFMEEQSVFIQHRTNYGRNYLNDVEFEFGLLPTPMWDEAQENYITVLANPITLYGIMATPRTERLSQLTAVIECWASEAYRLTTPALFESTTGHLYTSNADEVEMFDIIHDSIHLDMGRIFSKDLQYMSEIPSKAAASGADWEKRWPIYEAPLNKGIEKIVAAFQGLH